MDSDAAPDVGDLVIHKLPALISKKLKSFVKGHEPLLFLSELHNVLSELSDMSLLCVKIGITAPAVAGGASPSTSASLGARVLKCDDETGTVSALGAICGCPGR